MTLGSRRTSFGGLATLIVCLMCVASANGQAAQQHRPPMAEEVFKNIPVLKGIPVDEFIQPNAIIDAAKFATPAPAPPPKLQ